MPAQPPRITKQQAKALAALAKVAHDELSVQAGPRAFKRFLEQKVDGRKYGPTREQNVRLLRRAHETFGKQLEHLLLKYGTARVFRLARLRDATKIVERGRIKLADGQAKDLNDVTKADLDLVLRTAPLGTPHRSGRTHAPGATFAVPRDVSAIIAFLSDRLKSLRPRHPGVPLRFSVQPVRRDVPLHPTDITEPLRRLRRLLRAYQLVVEELLGEDLFVLQGSRFTKTVKGTRRTFTGVEVAADSTKRALRDAAR